MTGLDPELSKHFQIESEVELDFVIGQKRGWPVGMQRESPPEFRRRVLAAKMSYEFQLRSVDYTLKRYVEPELYEGEGRTLGDETSDYLRTSARYLGEGLKALHTKDASFGVFGAEFTLYRIPHALDVARMSANRGLLLEVLPVLRLCLEMMSWANVAFSMRDENEIISLKAQTCVSQLKQTYETAVTLYGYLSRFTHWGHVIHGHFLNFDQEQVGVVYASVRYRAMTLALCLVVLDVLAVVIRKIYDDRSDALILSIQGVTDRGTARKTRQYLSKISETSKLGDLRKIEALLS